MQTAIQLLEWGQRGIDRQFIVCESVLPIDLRITEFRFVERNEQIQIQMPLSGGPHAIGKMVDPVGDRALLDEFEKVGSGTVNISLDDQGGNRRIKIGDPHLRIGDLCTHDRSTIRLNGHAVALKTKVSANSFDERPSRGEIKYYVPRFDRYQKLAFAFVQERKVNQVALEGQFRLAGATGQQGITQPEACALAYCAGDESPDGARVGTDQCGVEIDNTRSLSCGLVFSLRRSSGVRPGEIGACQFRIKDTLIDFPLGMRIEHIKRNGRFRKNTRKINRHFLRAQRCIAHFFIGLKYPRQAGSTRDITVCLQRQPVEPGFQRIGLQMTRVAFPLRTQSTDKATRGKITQ